MKDGQSGVLRIAALLVLIAAIGCNRDREALRAPRSITLRSADFLGDIIRKACTCDGKGASPELSWSAPPAATRSLALVVTDRDSRFGYNFVHWVIYNIPASTHELATSTPPEKDLPNGAAQARNDDDKVGYFPPCPPGKSFHRYDFVLYAMDTKVNSSPESKKQLLAAIRGHVLAIAELMGRYRR